MINWYIAWINKRNVTSKSVSDQNCFSAIKLQENWSIRTCKIKIFRHAGGAASALPRARLILLILLLASVTVMLSFARYCRLYPCYNCWIFQCYILEIWTRQQGELMRLVYNRVSLAGFVFATVCCTFTNIKFCDLTTELVKLIDSQ